MDNKLDVVSTYPRVSMLLDISRQTCVLEFSRIKGVKEFTRRELGVNLTGGRVNGVEICQKVLGMPQLDELVDLFRREKGLGDLTTDLRYIDTTPLEPRELPPEIPRDDEILEDVFDPPMLTIQVEHNDKESEYEVVTDDDTDFGDPSK